jgi:hypothetical protein
MTNELAGARGALTTRRDDLLAYPNVVAVGIGYKVTGGVTTATMSIVVSVVEKRRPDELAAGEAVPATLDGVPTDVQETGVLRAWQSHTARIRPAPGGISIGHRDITAGTLGCLVRKNGERFILSNNHVLANSNEAAVGDPILQPGPYDGGRLPQDHIANLEAFVPLSFSEGPSTCPVAGSTVGALNWLAELVGSDVRVRAVSTQVADNLVDCAIARPLNPADVTPEILEIGLLQGSGQAELGMPVKKSGRTTALTTGRIQQIDVTADVSYGGRKVARFRDQVMAGAMSQGGDSGSAVLSEDGRLVGLLFAGSNTTTIINRIENVFTALGVGL